MQETEQWAYIYAQSIWIHVGKRISNIDSCLAIVQLTSCTTLQAATSVVASVIHTRYIGLDMTRKLSVPCHAPLAQQIGCETEEPAAAATNSHAAYVQVSSQVHALPEEAEAEPQNTAHSGPQHASKAGPTGHRPGRGEQQQHAPCGQTEHHVSFRQAPEQLGMPVRGGAAPAHKSSEPDNPFQEFIFGQSGKQTTTLALLRTLLL